jgi:hypothetical protein
MKQQTGNTNENRRDAHEKRLVPVAAEIIRNVINAGDASLNLMHPQVVRQVGAQTATAAIGNMAQDAFFGTPTFAELQARQQVGAQATTATIGDMAQDAFFGTPTFAELQAQQARQQVAQEFENA